MNGVTKFKRYLPLVIIMLFLAVILMPFTGINPVLAMPQMPHQFYGYAHLDGVQLGSSHTVTAKINGVQYGTTTTGLFSGYNFSLSVTAQSADPPVSGGINGDTVVFYVDGVQATPTSIFQVGGHTLINIYAYTTSLAVATNAATNIGSTTATLNGNLTALGANPSVFVSFQIGTSPTPPLPPFPPVCTMTSEGTFSLDITGLSPSTTYYFRAFATGSTTEDGEILSFTTPSPALTVITGSAAGVTATSATLTGTLTDTGGYSSVNVSFEWGPTTSYGNSVSAGTKSSTGAFSAPISGLTCGSTYYFRAIASSGSTTTQGSPASFSTTSCGGGSSVPTHWFWGTAYLNSTAVPTGTLTFYVDGIQKASTTTNSAGGYNVYVPGTSGGTITFRVNGYPSIETAVWQSLGYNGNFKIHASTGGALNIITTSLSSGNVGSAYSQQVEATGGTTPYTWSKVSGDLPAGLTLNSSGLISGTPTSIGTSSFTVRVTDSGSPTPATDDQPLSITINPAGTLTISTSSLPAGTQNTSYPTQTLQATGGTQPYSWSKASGNLPTGLSLSSTGIISGTPTASGTFSFTVQVTDATLATATKPLSITINPYTPGALTITTTSLPSGTEGGTYSRTVEATGGTTPYTWSIYSGSLPPGLSIGSTGTISGTATTAGTYDFTVRVSDSASANADKPLSITISPPNPKIIGPADFTVVTTKPADRIYMDKWYAADTGTMTRMILRCTASGNVKVAIYTDNNGVPGTLIAAVNESTPVNAGLNEITFPSTALTKYVNYWLAVKSDSSCIAYRAHAAYGQKQFTASYSADFPATAPTGTDKMPGFNVLSGWR
jgi:hypothetical protein